MDYLNRKTIWAAITSARIRLIQKVEQDGLYENFGQQEVRAIKDKFIDITDYSDEMNANRLKLDGFNEWCMNYTGE